MVWWGAGGVLDGEVTLGALIAFPIYLDLLFRPMRMLADKFNTLQMGLVAGERVFKVLDTTDFIENEGDEVVEKVDGNIEFKNVYFTYDGENDVIKDLSFSVEHGKSMAIVGSTGSGKTTIINILNRFYDIRSGEILIDGMDIHKYELFSYRKCIAMVLQDVFLFTGTVLDNIRLMDPDITREEVIKASKIVGAHPFIERLPNGYDFVIAERGGNLSMGQRQLISFVRALVFDPDILILDYNAITIRIPTTAADFPHPPFLHPLSLLIHSLIFLPPSPLPQPLLSTPPATPSCPHFFSSSSPSKHLQHLL